jgi:hypothetical protein
MSRILTPALKPATRAMAEIYSQIKQIKKVVGKVPRRPFLAWAALMIATACSANPPKPLGSGRADQATAEQVYSALIDDPVYFYRHVDVRVDDGVAHLSGHVWGTEALSHAQRVACDVSGVKAVVNHLDLDQLDLDLGGGG